MILVFDIGNTNIVVGIMGEGKLLKQFRFESDPQKTFDEYAATLFYLLEINDIKVSEVKAVMISSVVPSLTMVIKRVVENYLKVSYYIVDTYCDHGLNIKLEQPNELGSDRLMSAFAAYTMFKKNCITVDFGTATTLEVLTEKGDFLGGTIFPGVKLAAQVLHSKTAKLPEVEVAVPKKVVGYNTITAIQSGIFYGYLEMVDGMVDRIRKEVFSSEDDVMILATGGMGAVFSENSRHKMRYEPSLIPYGLYYMYKRLNK